MKNKKWLKIILGVLAFAAVCVGIFFILKALGVTDIESIRQLVEGCGAWGWIVFIALFVAVSTLTCCIPGTSATFIVVSIILFGAWKGFIISTASVFISSSLMFLIGDKLGEKAVVKLVGRKELEKAQELIDVKSKIFLPLMFLFPAFPDDALCMVAGMTKMRFWYFAVVVAIFRTIGIATLCFLGSGFFDWGALSLIDWFVLINVCVFDIVLIFKYSDKLEKRIKVKTVENKPIETPVQNKREKRIADLKTTHSRVVNNIYNLKSNIHNLKTKQEKEKANLRLEMYQKELAGIEAHLLQLEPSAKKFVDIEKEREEKERAIILENQNKIVERLTNIMKQFYPKVEYALRRSTTTVSVYLTFSNEFGVKKTIRFSDHAGKKGITSYRAKKLNSVKNMKAIIDKNMKVLSCKTAYELIEQLKGEKND